MAKIMLLVAFVACGGLPAAADQASTPVGRQTAAPAAAVATPGDVTRRTWVGQTMEHLLSMDGDGAAQGGSSR